MGVLWAGDVGVQQVTNAQHFKRMHREAFFFFFLSEPLGCTVYVQRMAKLKFLS